MCALLSHRGPDADGEWEDHAHGVWLGHRRLSILDLSAGGQQPMVSAGGRYVLTYNGEIYNYETLRRELVDEGCNFKGESDTEVVVNAIEVWGIERAVAQFVGMFAFGVYDLKQHCLWLVRDRFGMKPLYFSIGRNELVFASELRPLQCVPWFDGRIAGDALAAYFCQRYVPSPATIFQGACKLKPATMLRWDGVNLTERCYWALSEVAQAGLADPMDCTFEEASHELERRLLNSVAIHMKSDVQLGAFLSGGVDSSAIVSLMQAKSVRPISTYTVGFHEASHDESPYAKLVADHLNTEHSEHILDQQAVLDRVTSIASLYDEPFADSSNLPTFLLCQSAREHVTVALSGDGADEIFGGYPRYFWASRIAGLQRTFGRAAARRLGRLLQAVPAWYWDGLITWVTRGRFGGSEGLSNRVQRLGEYLQCTPQSVYDHVLSVWADHKQLLGFSPDVRLGPDTSCFSAFPWSEQMMAVDQSHQLPDEFLTKVDRASMAVSLEVRAPFLDHRIVEWSWKLPQAYKVSSRGDRGKLVLRDVLSRYVPNSLIERPKMGFGMPIGNWLRNELRSWAEDFLNPTLLRRQGVMNPSLVQRVWNEHLNGEDRSSQIWTALMFTQWMEHTGRG